MRPGFVVLGTLGAVAAAFFLVVARQADERSTFYPELQRLRAIESQATYAIIYESDATFGPNHRTARETAVRLGREAYRSETTDDSGYTIIVIQQPGAELQCESSDTITPQCYRTDLLGPPALDESFFDSDKSGEFAGATSLTEFQLDGPWTETDNEIVHPTVVGEPSTCFIEDSQELRSETCFSADGLVLYARSEFVLAGRTYLMIKEAISVDRHPAAIDLEAPYPIVEPPGVDLLEPVPSTAEP